MRLNSKADTILNLKNFKLKFLIPDTYVFSTVDWKNSKKKIIKNIKNKFTSKIVVRSSSYDEDLIDQSQAGKYLSILNVNSKSITHIKNSINLVIKSYKNNNRNNKIIIQKQITKVSMSGVIFTHDLTNLSPYYVINYDDKSKKTYTVTSGFGKDSNKKLIVYRKGIKSLKSQRFKKLLKAVIDLEKKLKNIFLDIEFVVDTDLNIYLLQVRNISIKKKNNNNQLIKKVNRDKKILAKKLLKKKIFAHMSDWNPAEIIGKNPKKLSSSLYSELVTNKSWSTAREQMGYLKMNKKKLMFLFSGKPYIDVKKSFYSFLPCKINKITKEKIVNFWLKKLFNHPFLHDKIEFEIAITSFCFDIDKKLIDLLPKNITNKEKEKLKNLYKQIFLDNLNSSNIASLEGIKKKIDELRSQQSQFYIDNSKTKNIVNLKKSIKNCKKLGIIPFAQAARHGFIAKNLINSLVKKRVFTNNRAEQFQKSIQTITSDFLNEINLVIKKKLKKKIFITKYGHLRPGTYDITSSNYQSMQKHLFKKVIVLKKNYFNLKKKEKLKISFLLKKNKINFKVDFIIKYIKNAIQLREYSKFVFSKSIDQIFKLIENIAPYYYRNKETLSFFSMNEILKNNFSRKLLNRRIKEYDNNFKIFLPELIKDKNSYDVIPYMFNVPNYITKTRVVGKVLFLKNKPIYNLSGKIILIENADPGFDWIFTKNIKGFVTQFGGSNSHMAIRAAELNIPAVIGCGQKRFEQLKICSDIEIDTINKKIEILR